MNLQSESVGITVDLVQYQNARIWEKGLRMACGRCHRSSRLKHFIYNAFYAECIKIAEEPKIIWPPHKPILNGRQSCLRTRFQRVGPPAGRLALALFH
jgi:hypothetical protein